MSWTMAGLGARYRFLVIALQLLCRGFYKDLRFFHAVRAIYFCVARRELGDVFHEKGGSAIAQAKDGVDNIYCGIHLYPVFVKRLHQGVV